MLDFGCSLRFFSSVSSNIARHSLWYLLSQCPLHPFHRDSWKGVRSSSISSFFIGTSVLIAWQAPYPPAIVVERMNQPPFLGRESEGACHCYVIKIDFKLMNKKRSIE